MKTQSFGIRRVHLVKLDRGDKLVESLKKACETERISSGVIWGIGAVSKARVIEGNSTDFLDPVARDFEGPMEIACATGNVSTKDGESYIHLHAALGRKDFSAVSGHLVEAEIYLTGEFFIMELDGALERGPDPAIKMFTLKV